MLHAAVQQVAVYTFHGPLRSTKEEDEAVTSVLPLQSDYKTKAELQKHSGLELPLRRGEWGLTSSAVRTVPIRSG